MLTTLIYRSQMHLTQETDLILLVEKANAENTRDYGHTSFKR